MALLHAAIMLGAMALVLPAQAEDIASRQAQTLTEVDIKASRILRHAPGSLPATPRPSCRAWT